MQKATWSVLGLVAVGAMAVGGPAAEVAPPPLPEPDAATLALWESRGCTDDERGKWFRDAKFGAFIHFGPYSTLGGYYEGKGPYRPAEQIIGLGDRYAKIPAGEYREKVAGSFNPTKFDAATWVRLMKNAGQKYVIFTTKHHDGFCMFKTDTTTHDVVDATPLGRDIVRELSEECRRQGLVFCPYYSIGDWCAADVAGPGFERTAAGYRAYMQAQLKELLTNYGEIPMLWFDNWWYVNDQWANDEIHAKDLYGFARSVRPGMLVNDRCGRGAASEDGDYATPENQLKGSLQERYFEVVMTNTADDNWGWVRGATNYRSAGELIRNLIDSVSKGGNFVVNVGPNADGEFPPEHVANLEKIGSWMRVNGEAIYGTRPAPEVQFLTAGVTAYATRAGDGSAAYLHIVEWPKDTKELAATIGLAVETTAAVPVYLDSAVGRCRVVVDRSRAPVTRLTIARPGALDPYATVVRVPLSKR